MRRQRPTAFSFDTLLASRVVILDVFMVVCGKPELQSGQIGVWLEASGSGRGREKQV
jgi:hypothetical protein